MAFPSDTPANGNNNFKKAAAFMNVSINKADGTPVKVGGIPLHLDKAVQKAIIDLIGTANEENLVLTYELRLAESAAPVELF